MQQSNHLPLATTTKLDVAFVIQPFVLSMVRNEDTAWVPKTPKMRESNEIEGAGSMG